MTKQRFDFEPGRSLPSPGRTGLGMAFILAAVLVGPFGTQAQPAQSEDSFTRTTQSYSVPDVTLRDRGGEPIRLRRVLAGDRPVLVQFIFTTCQTICPMLTATMAQAQEDLRRLQPDTRIVSISIDPEQDTPKRLRRYARSHGAEGDWTFLTGDWDAIRKTLGAFNAMYRGGNKMYHEPYTFIRPASSEQWVRYNGLMSADSLVAEYKDLVRHPTGGA